VDVGDLEYKVRRLINDYVISPKNAYKLNRWLEWAERFEREMEEQVSVTNGHELSKVLEVGHIVQWATFSARASLERKESRWGIPAFRLPGDEVLQAVWMLEKMKVRFQCGQTLGKELEMEKVEREGDALLLATGGGPPLSLNISGESLPGVYQGLDLLRQVRGGKKPKIGKSVIVIGGGNTAVDAALPCRKLAGLRRTGAVFSSPG